MKACEKMQQQLEARAGGSLPAEAESALKAHLAQCSNCRAAASRLDALLKALQGMPAPESSPFMLERIAALAVARRQEVLARRDQSLALAALALLSCAMSLAALPVFSGVAHWISAWLRFSELAAVLIGLGSWWGVTLLTGLGLIPLLRAYKWNGKERQS